jgi:hypothetical protein
MVLGLREPATALTHRGQPLPFPGWVARQVFPAGALHSYFTSIWASCFLRIRRAAV